MEPDSSPKPTIRFATESDLDAIGQIRNDAIAHSDALWTTVPESPTDIRALFGPLIGLRRVLVASAPESVSPQAISEQTSNATGNAAILGFADYMPLRAYDGYDETMEHSIYLTEQAQGRGIGTQLLTALIERARTDTVHSLIGNIAGNNAASIRLHEKLGFQLVGKIPEAGHKFDRWIDLVIMQKRF